MSKDKLNISVLVAARDEYMTKLKKLLAPIILDGFISIYDDSIEVQKQNYTYEYLKQFQRFLKDIQNWNQTILIKD